MPVPINVGYSIENTNSELKELKELERKKIIILQEDEYIQCKQCSAFININQFEGNSITECPNCGRQCGLSTSRKKRTSISSINLKNIINTIDSQLQTTFGKSNVFYDTFERNWIIRRNNKKYLIYIYGISTLASFLSFSKNEGLILYFDIKKVSNQIHNLNKKRFRYVFDPIFSSPEHLKFFIDSLDFTETLEYLTFREQFETFLSSINSTRYEQEFIPMFIEGIKQKHRELSILYSRLQLVENTILNTKCLKKGGSGREDFYLVDLQKYLQDGLKPEKYGESKKFKTTHFSFKHFMVALGHATNFGDSLFFVSTNDIAPSVWDKVIEEKRGGHFKYVILDKDLMLMLLYNLDLIHMINTPSIKK